MASKPPLIIHEHLWRRKLRIRMIFLVALVALTGCGGGNKVSQTNSQPPAMHNNPSVGAAVEVSNFNRPKLQVVGNGGKCSAVTNSDSFHFEGSGFTHNGKVMIIIFAPPTYKEPVFTGKHGSNKYRFYWYFQNFGVYRADAHGNIVTGDWDCLDGPGGNPDFPGIYQVKALDWVSGISSQLAHFQVIS